MIHALPPFYNATIASNWHPNCALPASLRKRLLVAWRRYEKSGKYDVISTMVGGGISLKMIIDIPDRDWRSGDRVL